MFKILLYMFCIVILPVINVFGQLKEGDSCVDRDSGKKGTCKEYASCPDAQIKFESFGIRPISCGSQYSVVCCLERQPRPKPSRTQRPAIVKRISENKCEEYSKPVTKTTAFVPLVAGAKPVNITAPKCTFKKNNLIKGGDPALRGEFPHMAALGWPSLNGYLFKCGGSLISEKYVLTAAHCSILSSRDTDTTSAVPTVVRLGDHDLRDGVKDGAQPKTVNIRNIIKYPDYKVTYDDIALVELDEFLEFNSYIRPACLWTKNDFDGFTTGIVTGWGAIDYRRAQSDVLLKASIDFITNDVCEPLFQHNRKWKGFRDTQICAGLLSGARDSCQGDSGGPLVLSKPQNDCIFYVTGITSIGYQCGAKNKPGIYTRVFSYVSWIESVVWSQ